MQSFKKEIIIAALSLIAFSSFAQVRLPRLIRDSMVLQRDAKINVWGWASAGEKVSIKFNGKTYKTTTGNDEKWRLQLAPAKAGGPYTMEIAGKNTISLHNILIGDVWLCAGQSNMVHQMKLHAVLYAGEIAKANYPEIRHFLVENTANLQAPQNDLPDGSWKWANPTDVNEFSAVAYFFAKALYEKYHVPIGLINASRGGSPIESWISEEGFKDFPSILNMVEKNKDTAYIKGLSRNVGGSQPSKDDKGINEKWYDPSYIPKGWRRIAIPGYWEDQGVKDLDGIVWYRRAIDVPASMINTPAKVFLGRIIDADELYINGTKIGSTAYLYPQRRYQVPDGVLKPGKNLFAIRVTNNTGKGGFVPDKPYQLIAGNDTIDLTGYWQYKAGLVNNPRSPGGSSSIALQNHPTALYNAMLAPVVGYSIKGFLWYQGEANSAKANEYAKLQPAMIADWRSKWKQGDLPFLFVQLPGFMDYNYQPSESNWAAFREAQASTLSVPNTAMAVAIDLGEWNDIHPDRKKEVGERLALAAEKIVYREDIVYPGPTYQSQTAEGNKIIISFDNVGSGLTTSDGEVPAEFAIAGADKKFVWAKAVIDGNSIIVSSDEVAEPKYVRYAWADNPVNPNLMNIEGLPAAPFETPSAKGE